MVILCLLNLATLHFVFAAIVAKIAPKQATDLFYLYFMRKNLAPSAKRSKLLSFMTISVVFFKTRFTVSTPQVCGKLTKQIFLRLILFTCSYEKYLSFAKTVGESGRNALAFLCQIAACEYFLCR